MLIIYRNWELLLWVQLIVNGAWLLHIHEGGDKLEQEQGKQTGANEPVVPSTMQDSLWLLVNL